MILSVNEFLTKKGKYCTYWFFTRSEEKGKGEKVDLAIINFIHATLGGVWDPKQ